MITFSHTSMAGFRSARGDGNSMKELSESGIVSGMESRRTPSAPHSKTANRAADSNFQITSVTYQKEVSQLMTKNISRMHSYLQEPCPRRDLVAAGREPRAQR